MIWVAVSLPLWVVGAIGFIMGVTGLAKTITGHRWQSCSPGEGLVFSFLVLMGAAVLFGMAAKVMQ